MQGVQITSRKGRVARRGILRDFTPGASITPRSELKIKSGLHGDMQRSAEMAGPHGDVEQQDQAKFLVG